MQQLLLIYGLGFMTTFVFAITAVAATCRWPR
jgi:hypothetical protein